MNSPEAAHKRHIQPEDVTWPVTIDEADAALAVIATQIEGVQRAIERYESRYWDTAWLVTLGASWARRQLEMQYARTRLVAKATATRTDLEAMLHESEARAVRLAAERDDALRRVEELTVANKGRFAQLQQEREDAVARRVSIANELRRRVEADKRREDRTAGLQHVLRIVLHKAIYAMRSMQAAGSPITPVAALAMSSVWGVTTRALYQEWMCHHASLFRQNAIERAASLGATCEEPDLLRADLAAGPSASDPDAETRTDHQEHEDHE